MARANPLRRLRRTGRRQGWEDVVAAYLERPLEFWGADRPRHAEKLEAKKQAVRARDGLDDAELVDALLELAAGRRRDRPAPVYVTGLGGSGSHWVAGMLGDLGGMVPAGEVYFPKELLSRLQAFDDADQAAAIDVVQLLHAWPRSRDIAGAALVNNAAGVSKAPSYVRWDPEALVFHLVRDPRDQVMAVTFRKQRFREYERPDASDEEYLRQMIRRNARSFRDARAVDDHLRLRWRYEDLCVDPRPMLRRVLALRGRPVDEQLVDRVAVRHDAETIRAGAGTTISNLDGGGRAQPWHAAATPRQGRLLHVGLADAVHGLGYPPDDCADLSGTGLDRPVTGLPVLRSASVPPPRSLRWTATPPGPAYRRDEGAWTPLPGADVVDLDTGTAVMLRIGEHDDLAALTKLGGRDVQVLCLAGNGDVDDDVLRSVAELRGLVCLDLARTPVTDFGLAALEPLDELRQLRVEDTRTTAQAHRDLIAKLPNVTLEA